MSHTIKKFKEDILQCQEAIAAIDVEIQATGSVNQEVENKIREAKAANMRALLGCVPEGITIEESDGRFDFHRSEVRFNSLFTVYSQKRGWFDEKDVPAKEINYYTTTCDTQEEFQRLALLGKVSERIMSFDNQELFDKLKEGLEGEIQTSKELKGKLMRLQNVKRDLESQIRGLKDKIELEEVEIGIKVDIEDNVWLELTPRKRIANVCGMKVVKKTPSGKNVDVEFTIVTYKFTDGNPIPTKGTITRIEKLKTESVRSIVREFKNQVERTRRYRLERELAEKESAS